LPGDNFKLDFVGIGFPKCGTTWIADVLSQHPEVDFSYDKESAYFHDKNYTYMLPPEEIKKRQKRSPKTFDQFKELFLNNGKHRGEFTTTYAYDTRALERIKAHNSNVRIIICTRDAVMASYSWYLYDRKYMSRNNVSKEEYFRLLENSSDFYTYFDYRSHIKKIMNIFDHRNLIIVDIKEVSNNPRDVWHRLLTFLDLPTYSFDKLERSKKNTQSYIRAIPGAVLLLKISDAMDSLPIDRRIADQLRKPGKLFMKKSSESLTDEEYRKAKVILSKSLGRKM
jgi:hypothetical protein